MPIIDCPVCKGTGNSFDPELGEYLDEDCMACRGTGELELTQEQYVRRERELAKFANKPVFVHRNAWQPAEIAIVEQMKTIKQTQAELHEAGYRRTVSAIRRMRFMVRNRD